jgi:hypothetical protein
MRKHETDHQISFIDGSGRRRRQQSVNLSEHFTFNLPPILSPPSPSQDLNPKSAPTTSISTIPILNKLRISKPTPTRHHSLPVGPETISALKGHLKSRPESRRSSVTSDTEKAVSAFSMLQLQNFLYNKTKINDQSKNKEEEEEVKDPHPLSPKSSTTSQSNSPKIGIKNLLN